MNKFKQKPALLKDRALQVTAGRLGFPTPAGDITRHCADVSAQDLSYVLEVCTGRH